HKAYVWFQETPYSFKSGDDFSCRPNRGPDTAPMFLLNHWIPVSPPDPGKAASVNGQAALDKRIASCISERGRVPTVVAVDFSEKGGVVATLKAINDASVKQARAVREREAGATTVPRPRETISTAPATTIVDPGTPGGTKEVIPARVLEPSVIRRLTGGDPSRFCPILPVAVRDVVAWAEAILGAPPQEAGLTDFAYGPVLARNLGIYVETAPKEVAERMRPLLA